MEQNLGNQMGSEFCDEDASNRRYDPELSVSALFL